MSEPSRPTNPVKERLRAGDVALGITVRISRTPDIARIAKATGHDFIFIDTQHSVFNLETTVSIAHTALAIGVAPLVRVRGIDDPDVSLLLDNGVTGIIYPDVADAAQARRAVDICKFPPIGKRSVVGGYPHFDFRSVPLTESLPQLNESCLLVCMIDPRQRQIRRLRRQPRRRAPARRDPARRAIRHDADRRGLSRRRRHAMDRRRAGGHRKELRIRYVGWAKRSVPTIFVTVFGAQSESAWARRVPRLCPPYGLLLRGAISRT